MDFDVIGAVPGNEAREADTWLVLTYQMPPDSAVLTARIRRKLTAAGAAYLSPACAVAPCARRAETAMRWVRAMIADAGGSAVLLRGCVLAGESELSVIFAGEHVPAR